MQDTKSGDDYAAGNGLLDRRVFLRAGVGVSASLLCAQAVGKEREPWSRQPGAPMTDSGAPSSHTAHIKRVGIGS
ncbi:MAG: hypothetical protein RIA65_02280, partial [Woeseia sp.]